MNKLQTFGSVVLLAFGPFMQAADPEPTYTLGDNGQVSRVDASGESVGIPCEGKIDSKLESWLERVEASSKRSQDVFRVLSKKQMLHAPADGTHTPAWNAEHMMGRHLQFFSQIYHSINADVPVLDRNPAQMPKDFTAANSEWDGARYADEMAKVAAFCRYYAPLLGDVDLDAKPPASRWPTLIALLKQMERHYDEHTANVKKKFELPDWPSS